VRFIDLEKYYKNIYDANDIDKISLANMIAFPQEVSKELLHDIFIESDNMISEIIITGADYIIGGYISKIITGYMVIFVKEIIINPKLKSKQYAIEILSRIAEKGLELYGENFKGIVSLIPNNIKSKSNIKQNYFLNFGGKIVPECARLKNKFFHCIYVPYNGGCDSEEIKEIFKSII
jgi:hypothetical protein